MYFVYVLKSFERQKSYVGHTDDLEKRLNEHNAKKSYYTRRYGPWKIVHREAFELFDDAIAREKYFKSAAGRRWLKKNVHWQ